MTRPCRAFACDVSPFALSYRGSEQGRAHPFAQQHAHRKLVEILRAIIPIDADRLGLFADAREFEIEPMPRAVEVPRRERELAELLADRTAMQRRIVFRKRFAIAGEQSTDTS